MTTPEAGFFGPGGQLFGCLHRPGALPSRGVVLVPPVFGEQIQFHRALFVLAERLAGQGLAVLRYDHLGTGDSAGGLRDASVAAWQDGVHQAVRFLRTATSVRRVSLTGARLGAAVALAAAPQIGGLDRLACWSPIRGGDAWLRSLVAAHRRALGHLLDPAQDRLPDANGDWDMLGFTVPAPLFADIAALAPTLRHLPPATPVLLVGSDEELTGWAPPPGFERIGFRTVEPPNGWLDPDDGTYDVLTPLDAVEAIAGHLVDAS